MAIRLQDKIALVTGATSNIGRAILPMFAAEGHMLASAVPAGSAAPRLSRSDPRGVRARRLIAADLDGRGCSPARASLAVIAAA
jgi:NAD(P)-dependent dehydrogenase (short-subunit alcohol dehydrogenase family)